MEKAPTSCAPAGDAPAGNTPAGDAPPAVPTLSWKVHLLLERPVRGAIGLGVLALVFLILHLAGDDEFLPIAALVFLISLAPFYLPTTYELTPSGVTRRIAFLATTRRWEEFPRFYHNDEGVKLSTFRGPSRLEPFRGLSLRFAGNRDAVIAYISRHVTAPDAAPDAGGAPSPGTAPRHEIQVSTETPTNA